MTKRDDAISIKELVRRANSNRSKVYKTIIQDWKADPINSNFIFQIDAPGTKTGKMWFIKKPAISKAIQTLTALSPAEQGKPKREQEQGIRIEQDKTRNEQGEQEQDEQGMNKVDVSFVEFLKEQITKKDSVIEKLQSQLEDREKNWVNQFELIKKMLPLPKEEAKDAAELFSDRNAEMGKQKEATPEAIREDYQKDNLPDFTQSIEQSPMPEPTLGPEPMPEREAVPPSEPNSDTKPKPFTGGYERTEGDIAQSDQPQQDGQLESSINNGFSDESYTQRQENNSSI